MAGQKGRAMRIKIGDGGSPETFTAIAGAREDGMSSENGEIDTTDKDSSGYRELIEGGVRTLTLNISGVVKDDTLRAECFDATITNYEVEYEDGAKVAGAFQVRSYEETGAHDGAVEFSGTLESAGAFTYTAAP